MHFGATLRLLRTSSRLSLSALAAQVGVSPAYISRVEHGHDAPPTPDRLRTIAQALRLPHDALTDLVEELRPDAADWLGHTAAGRHLAAELRRRALGPAQLARVAEFVRREFPIEEQREGLGALFTEEGIVAGVSAPSLADAFDVAVMRLVARSELARVAAEVAAQARGPGAPPAAIGGGLCLGHARAAGRLRGILLLVQPLDTPTPDGVPVRAVALVVGPDEAALAGGLARAAQLTRLIGRVCDATSAAEVLAVLG